MMYLVVYLIIILAALVSAPPVEATEYYVAKTGSDSNNCTAAQSLSTPKLTLTSALTCWTGGDTIWMRAGAYSATINSAIPSGLSNSQRTTISAYNNEVVTVTLNGDSNHGILLQEKRYITLYGIDWVKTDLVGTVHLDAIKIAGTTATSSYAQDITISGPAPIDGELRCKVRNGNNNGISAQGPTRNLAVYNCDVTANAIGYGGHGLYIQNSENFIMEGNWVHGNGCFGMQIYPYTQGAIIRNNRIGDNGVTSDNGATTSCKTDVVLASSNHLVEHNVFYHTTGSKSYLLKVQYTAPANQTIRHNTFYGPGMDTCVYISSSASNTLLQNNIILGCGTLINNLGTNTTQTTNLTTGTPSNIFTNLATGDFTLKSGSAAINTGTNIGQSYCGTAPDRGAFEVPVVTAASIFGNTLDVTVCSTAPPMQPLGTWTPACTGTGCGTPVTSGTPAITGGGLVRVTVSGITGNNCAAGQTWTISASGANTDSALVGGAGNQLLPTTTSFAVDSAACDGSGTPAPPASSEAHYEFENDTTDSSGNGNDAIGSASIGYAAAKTGQGVQFTQGVDSYVDTGLLSGYTLGASSLTIAVGVRLAPGDVGRQRSILGTSFDVDQLLHLWKSTSNTWRASVGTVIGEASEFAVTAGDTHLVLQFDAATNTATLCVNGVAGTIADASVFTYADYAPASTLRIGLPSGYSTSLSGEHIVGDVRIYQSVESCDSLYAAWQPPVAAGAATQVAHQWQGVHLAVDSSAEDRGDPNEQRTVVKGGAAALMAQINNETGGTLVLQPRFRYNINGGDFSNVVPDEPTADGVSYWGSSIPTSLNANAADGPISGALSHTDGLTLTNSAAVPTLDMGDDTSYTIRGIFRIDAAIGDVVCFKLYDQGGSELASYTPAAGACLTVISQQASGGF